MSFDAAIASFTPNAAFLPPLEQTGAYGVILNGAGEVLTVRGGTGRLYLPGGRIEAGETPRQALVREIAEECGWSAAILSPLRQSSQPIMGGDILLRTSHWRARLLAPLGTEAEFTPSWLPPSEALSSLHREADCAALRAAVRHQPSAGSGSRSLY